MTTFSYTIELDDSERIMLDDALAMLKEECDLQIAKKQGARYHAHLSSIASVKKKLVNSGQQMSTNTFAIQVEPPAKIDLEL